MIGIYKITSPSGKIYIGQSWNIKDRFRRYKSLKCKQQRKLYNSFIKYNVEKHIFEIIHELPNDIQQKILDDYEIFYHNQYKNCNITMLNIREPGKGGKLSNETKKKISIANSISQIGIRKGWIHSEETKNKIKLGNLGKIVTDESRKKMSLSKIGTKVNLGRKATKEAKENMSKAQLGKYVSEETKIKMSESAKIAWQKRRKNVYK